MQKKRKTRSEGSEYTKQIDAFVSSKLLQMRLERGIPRSQICKVIDVTNQQLAKYETGANRISIGRLVLIANVLGEPISTFCKDSYDNIINKEKFEITTNHQQSCHEILQNFMKIRRVEDQRFIKDLVKSMVRNQRYQ